MDKLYYSPYHIVFGIGLLFLACSTCVVILIFIIGDMMKKALVLSFLVCFLGVCYVNRYNIADWFLKNYFDNKTATLDEPNEYYKDYDYKN